MKVFAEMLVAFAALTLGGCATTIEIPAGQSLEAAFSELRETSSAIHLRSGATLDADSAMTTGDSITVWQDGNALTFPLQAVSMVSTRSTGAGIAQGLGIGFLVGAGFGVLAGFSEGDDPPSTAGWDLFQFTAGEKALLLGGGLGVIMGVAGAITGGIIGQRTYYELPQTGVPDAAPSDPELTGIAPGDESADDASPVTITVPKLESQDRISIRFYWNGRLQWLPKSGVTMREVPDGVAISMPLALRRTLN